jgi:hypothetical protein
MKKLLLAVVCGASVALVSGCSSIRITNELHDQALSDQGQTIAHINATVSGLYFLGFLPIWCGSPTEVGQPVFFSDKVTLTDTVSMLTKKSKAVGAAKVLDMQSCYDSSPVIPFLFSIKKCQVSGNCVR